MFNFNRKINRKKTKSAKWDLIEKKFVNPKTIPFCIADMDFAVPKNIKKTLVKRAKHPIYGYSIFTDNFYKSIINFIYRHYKWKIEKDWIIINNNILSSIGLAIQALLKKGESIVIQTPTYNNFYELLKYNNCNILKNPLILKDNIFKINFIELEKLFKFKTTKMLLFVNPHNPSGRVFSKEELMKIIELCKKYKILIVSDEIHSNIIFDNKTHYSLASLSSWSKNNSITMMSPSKTFNMAGLSISISIIPNENNRRKFLNAYSRIGGESVSIFGMEAIETAYTYCDEWLKNLICYLENNRNYTINYLAKYLPETKYYGTEGTFLMFFDFSNYGKPDLIEKKLIFKGNVGLNNGIIYGKEGKGFFRFNIGCPKKILEKGLKSITEALKEN